MKLLAHFVPRAGGESAFDVRIREVAEALAERGLASGIEVGMFERLADDPFGRETPYRATLELRGSDFTTAQPLVTGLGDALLDVAHPDLSTCLVGEDVAFVSSTLR